MKKEKKEKHRHFWEYKGKIIGDTLVIENGYEQECDCGAKRKKLIHPKTLF